MTNNDSPDSGGNGPNRPAATGNHSHAGPLDNWTETTGRRGFLVLLAAILTAGATVILGRFVPDGYGNGGFGSDGYGV